jgi:hypothetical protein
MDASFAMTNKKIRYWVGLIIIVWSGFGLASAAVISVEIRRSGGGFDIQGSYMSPLTQCQAYALLTDFSSDEPSEGIKSSKMSRLADGTIRVEQLVEDRFLFFSTQFESIIDYTEYPIRGMDLRQIKGYFKEYRGSWRLIPKEGGTLFTYQAFILPESSIPMFLIEHFMNNRVQQRFEKMANRAKQKKDFIPERCQ